MALVRKIKNHVARNLGKFKKLVPKRRRKK